MAKAKKFKAKQKMTIPVAVVAGFGVPAGRLVNDWFKYRDVNIVTREAGQFFTGYDWTTGQFNMASLRFGLVPVIAGTLVHKFIGGKLGVNRALAKAKIPLLRL